MSYSERIRAHRKSLGMTEAQYAEQIGVSRGSVQQWERGVTAPSRARQPAVAQFIGITVAQLMGENDGTEPGPAIGGRVPLLSDVQAGDFVEYVDNFQPGDGGQELIATSVPVKQHTFALRVVGDSMEPEFREGMILIIEPEMDPLPGDYVVAKNGDDATTFKQLVKDGADWYLKPLNPRYPIKPLAGSRVIGVLRAVEKRYR